MRISVQIDLSTKSRMCTLFRPDQVPATICEAVARKIVAADAVIPDVVQFFHANSPGNKVCICSRNIFTCTLVNLEAIMVLDMY